MEDRKVERGMKGDSCELGFVICGHPAIARCSICGQDFCAIHGNHELEVCRNCLPIYLREMEKQRELATEETRRRIAEKLNSHGRCGHKNCGASTHLELCQRCMTWYCPKHITTYSYRYQLHRRDGIKRMNDQIALCEACAPHLRDYEKDMF
ncbi:MAG: hypothetical protein M1319_05955 [Chloroflexi bacterium]|nr:hypothetical protein [Chloroflexota bacterium]